jgi:hypothetical protein
MTRLVEQVWCRRELRQNVSKGYGMRRYIRVSVVLLLLVLCSSSLLAVRPTIEYLDLGGAFTLTGVCPFDIYEQPTGNKEKIVTFYNQAGEIAFQVITGVNKWRLTNLSTGTFIDVNASGPARLFVQPGTDALRVESGGVSFFYIQNPPPGIPSYGLTRGRVVSELDLTTFAVVNLIAQQGTVQDICALLH